MSNIDKQAVQAIADLKAGYTLGHADVAILNEMARNALASPEAEPVEWRVTFILDGQPGSDFETTFESQAKMNEIISLHERAGFSARITPLFTAPPANAEPVAWLWSHRKHPSEVSIVRPEDDERAEGAHWSGWSCQALYAAPPAPVSVPECFKRLLHHAYGMTMGHDWNKGTMAGHHRTKLCQAVEECRAAMLQGADGNSQVIPDGWVACSERMPEIGQKVFYYFDIVGVHAGYYDGDNTFVKENGGGWLTGDVTHWMEWILPAPPKREV